VDDDETELMMSESVLSALGFEVQVYANPSIAFDVLVARLPDVLVLDVMMPGLDGFEFCRRFRELPGGDAVPILMTTALDDLVSINRAYELGATEFTVKPINWTIEGHRLRYMLRSAETAAALRTQEQQAMLAKAEWEMTFDAIADLVIIMDRDQRVLRANRAVMETLGGSGRNLVGTACHEMFLHSDSPCDDCPTAVAIRTGQFKVSENAPCRPGGHWSLTAWPIKDERGDVSRVVQVMRDLTERNLLEAELRQSRKMEAIGTLAGGIAHEFNNLLQIIWLNAEMVSEDLPASSSLGCYTQEIANASRRGRDLIQQLLSFSRRSMVRSPKACTDLNPQVQSFIGMFSCLVPQNITLRTSLSPSLDPIHGDAHQLQQVLMNLSVNSIQSMPQGGTLTIETRNVVFDEANHRLHPEIQPGRYVLVSISDSGHGMPKEIQERIYDPFFTTKPVGQGAGLGLSAVYGIVKEHQGCILCYSQVGVGTTFNIYLPALPKPDLNTNDSTKDVPNAPRSAASGDGKRILVVDDEAPIRSLMRRSLSQSGYSVTEAYDGLQALRTFESFAPAERPELVILDLDMPQMNGWDCLQRIKTLDPKVLVLITTGYGGAGLLDRARQSGAAGLLNKPYSVQELVEKVQETLAAPNPTASG